MHLGVKNENSHFPLYCRRPKTTFDIRKHTGVNMKTPDRFLRLFQILGSKSKAIEPIIPIRSPAWYEGINEGIYPPPIKLSGGRTSVWRESDIQSVVAGTYTVSERRDEPEAVA